MPVYELDTVQPKFDDPATNWIAPDAHVVGNVQIGRDVSLWFGVVIRGDNEPITIGEGSNIQEHAMMHTDPGMPLTVGKSCTIGHGAILHGCTIGDNSLVGMGAIVLNGARIGKNSLVGAGALVTEGKEFPDNSLIVGAPAKAIRTIERDEIIRASAAGYVANGKRFGKGLKRID